MFQPGDTVMIYPAHEEAPAWVTQVVKDEGKLVLVKSDMPNRPPHRVLRRYVGRMSERELDTLGMELDADAVETENRRA